MIYVKYAHEGMHMQTGQREDAGAAGAGRGIGRVTPPTVDGWDAAAPLPEHLLASIRPAEGRRLARSKTMAAGASVCACVFINIYNTRHMNAYIYM